jgi:DNA-binding NarL/FixJ family response regulator
MTRSEKIRILLVDDHALLRHGLSAVLSLQKDFEVVGEAGDGHEAVKRASQLRPDVIIMDLAMPRINGAEATKLIKAELPDTKVMILTTFGMSADVSRALEAGASGAIVKDTAEKQLVAAIRGVFAGRTILSPEIRHMLDNEPQPPELTERQLDILLSISRGLTNKDIATQFGLSPSGVKTHLEAILAKLGAATRAEAVGIAMRKQLLKL